MRRVFPVLVLLLLSAGCASPDGAQTDAEAPDPAPALASAITLAGCRGVEAVVPVPMDEAAATLPEGYEPAPYPFDVTGTQAALVTETLTCEEVGVDATPFDKPVSFAFAFLQVIPPEESGGDAEFQVVPYGSLTDAAEIVRVLTDWGLSGVVKGDGTVNYESNADIGTSEASATSAAFSIESHGTADSGTTEAYAVRVHDLSGGPVFDIRIETSDSSLGQGGATLQGLPFTGGEGLAYVRAPSDGLLATFVPVRP